MSYLADVVEVGGNEENPFKFNGSANGATLKKITVWFGEWQLRAIKVCLTNGESELFGKPQDKVTEFIFEDGEHFTSLSLWPNGNETRVAAIKFRTSRSREFFVRIWEEYLHAEVPVDVASGICMGIKGLSADNIHRLGFMFLNNIKSTVLTSVEYPTLLDVIPKVSAREIKSMTYHNNTSETQEYTIETSKTITQKSSWSITAKLEFTASLEVKAGIPLLAEGQTRYELTLGVEGTYAKETTEENMTHFSFPVKVPPGKTVDVHITIGKTTVNLPFNGVVKITCHNDAVLKFKTSGTYKGITYTGGNVVVNESAIKLGEASLALM